MAIDLRTEQNAFVLREVAMLLDRENKKLHEKIARLVEELAQLKGGGAEAVQLELQNLRELLERREQALFGDSSEKRPAGQSAPKKARAPRKGHGPTPQLSLPIRDVVHVLDEPDRSCPKCGLDLAEIPGQYETSEEITVIERRFEVQRHLRTKYRCRCNGHIETAPGPQKLQPGARYSVDFAIEVAADKYLLHLPLERQVRAMAAQGLTVTSQALWDQIEVLARHLEPTYQALIGLVLVQPVIGADETHWRVMGKRGKEENKRWWAWCIRGPDAAAFRILESRSKEAAGLVLGDYGGTVVADGYAAYSALVKDGRRFQLAACWAHVRRKYYEIRENYPLSCKEILDLIGELYAVEKLVPHEATEAVALSVRADVRERLSRPLVERIRQWAMAQTPLPGSGLASAIGYMTGLWGGLTRFLHDPRVPLDNNGTERALRGPVVGRKNYYVAHSRRGTEVAAVFYTMIETAKLQGLDPKTYLRRAVLAALASPGTATLPNELTSAA